jgi:ribosomal protein S18 acetylase RimI-like enzyme
MADFRICNYLQGEENDILDLVKTGFDEFVSSECTEEGAKFFYGFIDPEEFRKRNQSDTFTLTAKTEDGYITGIIEARYDGHICLLFVRKEFQHKGISKELFNNARNICMQKAGSKVIMTVNSSIYAVDLYKKLGFTTVGNEQTINGIRFIEMEFMTK